MNLDKNPLVRTILLGAGCVLMLAAPVVGALPGPGGIVLAAAGLTLILRYSGWARRHYVRLSWRWPRPFAWTDWALRRKNCKSRSITQVPGKD